MFLVEFEGIVGGFQGDASGMLREFKGYSWILKDGCWVLRNFWGNSKGVSGDLNGF